MDEQLPENICTSVAHYFEAAWSGEEGTGYGVLFCRWCGEVRRIEVTPLDVPESITITNDRGVPKVWRG